jgi:hypothetical protein
MGQLPAKHRLAAMFGLREWAEARGLVNRKTAKALGLTIPTSLLLRADEIID